MSTRRSTQGSQALIAVVLVFGILVALNVISQRFLFHRLDLTKAREYTISPSTKKVLGDLKDVVNLKVYVTKKLPQQLVSLPQDLKDFLDEYQAFSNGKVKVEWIDPSKDAETEAKARSLGIVKVPLGILEKDQQQVVEVYSGLVLLYQDKKEVFPYVQGVSTLEYDLTAALVKLTEDKKKVVGFLTGHGERDLNEGYQALNQYLAKQYEVKAVDVANGQAVPDDVTTLIVAGPKQPLGERDKFAIDQFIMRGGKAVFLVDAVQIDAASMQARPIDPGLNDLLGHYGARVRAGAVVADWKSHQTVQFQSNQGGFRVVYPIEYPLWLTVPPQNFAVTNPATAQLGGLVVPWSGAVDLVEPAPAGIKSEVLFKTSAYATIQENLIGIEPMNFARQQPSKSDLKTYTLAAAFTGPFESFYKGKPVPPATPAAADPTAEAPPQPAPVPDPKIVDKSPPTTVVVIANAEFAADNYVQQNPTNVVFVLNLVDWLTLGNELIGIRARAATHHPLKVDLSEAEKTLVRVFNIIIVPLAIAAFGLTRRVMRRKSRGETA